MNQMIENELKAHQKLINEVIAKLQPQIQQACQMAVETLQQGGKIMFCGNGGSAADAQHLAAEISGRYVAERPGLAGLALTTDTSVLTSIGNDFGFDYVFARQVEGLANKGDLLVGISTSGNSPNVLNAFKVASEKKCKTLGLTGRDGGKFNDNCDLNIVVPSSTTARIQEMHILIGHIICQAIDDAKIK